MTGKASLAIVLLLLISFVQIHSVMAYDQPSDRIVEITNYPSGVSFQAIEWNKDNYDYAIAVGNDTGGHNVIYRFWSSNHTWDELWTDAYGPEVLYDITYISGKKDTFFVVGDDDVPSGESQAYMIKNASGHIELVEMGEPAPGGGFTAVCFDSQTGPEGTVVAVGSPYSDNRAIIAWYDMTWNAGLWEEEYLPTGIVLTDVTVTYDTGIPLIIAVGYDTSSGKAIAYAFNYEDIYALNTPPDAEKITGIDWKPSGGYGVLVGQDHEGKGRMWKISDVVQTRYISYYNRTSGYEALKIAYWDGHTWKKDTIDSSQYAGYYNSIAVDRHGMPHISYWDGSTTVLKHAWYDGNAWQVEVVDDGGGANVGQYTSIAIDSNDHIHISYYDYTNTDLKYAYFDGSTWTITAVDTTNQVGWDTSICTDEYDHPHISYYDATNGDLKYATYAGSWTIVTVDSINDVGRFSSIGLDSQNNPHISYLDSGAGVLKHAYGTGGGSWTTETAQTGIGQYSSLVVDRYDNVHIAYVDNGLRYITKASGVWGTSKLVDATADMYTTLRFNVFGQPVISYYDGTSEDLKFAYFDPAVENWKTETVDSYGDVGYYSSLALGMGATYSPIRLSSPAPVLNAVRWESESHGAIAVGNHGAVFVYYADSWSAYNWTVPAITTDFLGVGVKSPGSPGYAVAAGSSGAIVSYQTYNTETEIRAKAIVPHINEMALLDRNGNNVTNQQVDVGANYFFFINGSYEEGWEKVQIDIYAWFDAGDENTEYNETPGSNINFHLRYTPDTTDPYNNSGTWRLLWPDSSNPSITLGTCIQQVEDKAGGTPGINDPKDYYLLWANITLHEQVRYAPGDGTWEPATNQSDITQYYNDLNSWNFNITIKDTLSGVGTENHDEFGIYAYTEVSAANNPTGGGAPGETVTLSPNTRIFIRSNIDYFVTVNISDLHNGPGDRIIPRSAVAVRNPTASNDQSLSYIYDWRNFTGTSPLYVWGNNATGTDRLAPLDYGTYSAGLNYGYGTDVYTEIEWVLTIPPSTPEDEYVATVVIQISY